LIPAFSKAICTVAPVRGFPSVPVTVPLMVEVVTCAIEVKEITVATKARKALVSFGTLI
jgi:hypothetical protein